MVRGFATCKVRAQLWLEEQLANLLDYLAITDVNRYQHFTAVPELIPGGAAFYEALMKGELGFDLIRRFKNYPSIAGLEFRDDGSEPTFTGFDHPAVMVFTGRMKRIGKKAGPAFRNSSPQALIVQILFWRPRLPRFGSGTSMRACRQSQKQRGGFHSRRLPISSKRRHCGGWVDQTARPCNCTKRGCVITNLGWVIATGTGLEFSG